MRKRLYVAAALAAFTLVACGAVILFHRFKEQRLVAEWSAQPLAGNMSCDPDRVPSGHLLGFIPMDEKDQAMLTGELQSGQIRYYGESGAIVWRVERRNLSDGTIEYREWLPQKGKTVVSEIDQAAHGDKYIYRYIAPRRHPASIIVTRDHGPTVRAVTDSSGRVMCCSLERAFQPELITVLAPHGGPMIDNWNDFASFAPSVQISDLPVPRVTYRHDFGVVIEALSASGRHATVGDWAPSRSIWRRHFQLDPPFLSQGFNAGYTLWQKHHPGR